MADHIDAAVFGAHFSGVARVPGCVCRVFHLPVFLYVLSALGVALPLLGFSPINLTVSSPANVKKKHTNKQACINAPHTVEHMASTFCKH
jgi:hypothetical protein